MEKNKTKTVKITRDEWSRLCQKGNGQVSNGQRVAYIGESGYGRWFKVELI